MIKRLFILFVLANIFFSCAKPAGITQEEFDMNIWKADPMACNGDREKLEDDFIAVKDKLIGTSISDVRKVLGKPDRVDLDNRSTKQYVYFVSAGGQCDGNSGDSGKSYKIFFDALELVKEVTPIL
ncbi:hypothetical protein [Flammeovirga aprica]|uniref:Lipoprotein SmpA/OmlA domain-containing protein n=1 Tax=Flammeovirga aprica JL-4 TaxID=694437 RepID=A0A7X9RZ31_9BACT|nr:hypothetical protein [Flammeovirga aprica]NME71356.1 hypothetical protein [Flammeovirga aprica JL-4]